MLLPRSALLIACLLASLPAAAHFNLVSPGSWDQQDSSGSPQKSPPCGQADPGQTAVETGVVTSLRSGTTLTLTINETIAHPGHYRVAIAPDQASLPADPMETPNGTDPCGSVPVDPNPTLPLLADGVFTHTAAFNAPQTVQIPLPAGYSCAHCTLQVIEFMSQHGLNNPGRCLYHHCAVVSITADGGLPDGGAVVSGGTVVSNGGGGVSNGGGGVSDGGAGQQNSNGGTLPAKAIGGCSMGGAAPWACTGLAALAALMLRRRSRIKR